MHVKQADVNGSSNIGLYGYANDSVAILGASTSTTFQDHVKAVLGVPVVTTTIAGTNLVGAFLTGNNNAILAPDIIEDHEREALDDINTTIIPTTYTCLGNNILATNQAALASPAFSDAETQRIGDELGVTIQQRRLGDIETIGSLGITNEAQNKLVISNDITDEDYEFVTNYFDADTTPSSVNMGAAQLSCGVLCNKNGFLVGKASGGPEVTRIDEGLGYT